MIFCGKIISSLQIQPVNLIIYKNMDKQSLIVCKPFKKTHFEQLRLVTSFDWIDFNALNNIDNEILGILNDADENLIDDARKQKIISSINQRIEYIHNLALKKIIDDIE